MVKRDFSAGFFGGLLSGLLSADLFGRCGAVDEHAQAALEESFSAIFTRLHADLCRESPEWSCLLLRPRWWCVRRLFVYWRIWNLFIAHGFVLTDDLAWRFYGTPAQQPGEARDVAMVRRLRAVWQEQIELGGVVS